MNIEAIHAFFAGLSRQSPGSDGETEAALALIADTLPETPVVADLGCGTGASTFVLARRLQSKILALDLAPLLLEELKGRAGEEGLSRRVEPIVADMSAPPIPPGSLDLLWCEGAVYNLGFQEALIRWRPLMKPDGAVVVSDCTWLSDDPPEEARAFWRDGYPSMTTIAGNIAKAGAAGLTVTGTRILPAACWDDYYALIEERLAAGWQARLDPGFAESLRVEADLFARSRDSYGYVFYVMRLS